MDLQQRNLKGNITDTLFIIVSAMVIMISLMLAVILNNAVSGTAYYNRISSSVRDLVVNVIKGGDYLIPFFFFLFAIISIISASKLNTKPALYMFVIVFAPIVLLFAHLFSDLTKTVLSANELSQSGFTLNYFYTNFPMSMFVIDNLFTLTLFVFVGILVVSYIGGRFGI